MIHPILLGGYEAFEIIPYFILIVLGLAFAYWIVGVLAMQTQPPTTEPVIGHYRIFLMGQGIDFTGITTTARGVLDANYLSVLNRNLPEIDKLIPALIKLNYYAIRNGKEKVLLISASNLEDQVHADSSRGNQWVFPFGTISYRDVFATGGVVTREINPTLWEYFGEEWDAIVPLIPMDLQTGAYLANYKEIANMQELGTAVSLVKKAALNTEEAKSLGVALDLQGKRLDETLERLAEYSDKANLEAQRSSVTTPFSTEEGESGWSMGSFHLTKLRVAITAGAAFLGYAYLPQYYAIQPMQGLLLGAVGALGIFYIRDNYL